ncbi:SDR family NAD(P)-dependent oxidoreductase [Streptomyces sp. MBT62]|uniref:SDR family NAD(P)-dependent oxidoreductase n=1 Tax=Streptomyces sp. MBT62 TaxID=2800410 RepID=UPI00190D2487|nr:SDR family oxidoreductase [Streptomyces sp. MBT62]MBK3566283.1 SDR family oxidoreductase [Streptomyces sp. MBT62]
MYEPATFADLTGRTIAVTGAARGIGEAHVLALVRNGVNVVAGDLDESAVRATTERLSERCRHGATIVPMGMDVTRAEDHHALAERALRRFGTLDGWINNAGVYSLNDVLETSGAEFTRMHEVHVLGTSFGVQAAAPAIGPSGGAIVNVASIAAYVVRARSGAYSASKAAVEHLTKFQAVELGPRGIRVNAVAPGMIDTDMLSSLNEEPGMRRSAVETVPLRRIGTPGEVSDAVLFLLSDASRFVTGHTLVVDGGGRHR